MHRLKYYLIIWFVCGVIGVIIGPVYGEHLRWANETGSQSIRTREHQEHQQQQHQHQHQSPYQYGFSKPNNRSRGGMNELRHKQKLYEQRQNDDPDQNSLHRSSNPIHIIQLKIKESEKAAQRMREDSQNINTQAEEAAGIRCNFETECRWKWDITQNETFQLVTGSNLTKTGLPPGPSADNTGHFLHLRITPSTTIRTLKSPMFGMTKESCRLEMFTHQSGNKNGKLRIVIEPINSHDTTTASSWVPNEQIGNDDRKWQEDTFPIGRVSQDFRILFEVVPNGLRPQQRGHVSIDNLRLRGCFEPNNQIKALNGKCHAPDVKCTANKVEMCISSRQQCDINIDCDNKEDEMVNCEKIPFGGMCDFESSGWCGWQNSGKAIMVWQRHSGPTPTEKTGPDIDHTFENYNSSGHYLFVNMNQHAGRKISGFASNAVINSIVFNPPPYAHLNTSSIYQQTCMARFYIHQFGKNTGSLNFSVVEIKDKENITSTLWWSSREIGSDWKRFSIIMPNITSRYYLQFEARMGMRIFSDVAIDDFSLSPECFGLNIPAEHLQGYNYYDQRILQDKTPHVDFVNQSIIELSTCNTRGREGPTQVNCSEAYNNTEAGSGIQVIEDQKFKGVQVWSVPSENYYTIIAKGAGGGLGSRGIGSSRGALAISVFELHKDEKIYILVGQKGESACMKSFMRGRRENDDDNDCESNKKSTNGRSTNSNSKTKQIKDIVIEDDRTGGGGGGATFIFLLNSAGVEVPLMVAGGGGGLGIGHVVEDNQQHGRVYDPNRREGNGQRNGEFNNTGGAGGGWCGSSDNVPEDPYNGEALLEGAHGGEACYASKRIGIHGQGGFGGGGGGCRSGGGGGGYRGGDTFKSVMNGEGGTSYIGFKRSIANLSFVYAGDNIGHGSVVIVPALPHPACGCDYRCVVLDEFSVTVRCICPEGWRLKKENQTACEPIDRNEIPMEYLIIFFAVVTILLIAALAILIFILYNRYQRKKQIAMRHKVLLEQDLQLSRLRHNPEDQQQTNFNPNYGNDCMFTGAVDVKTLPHVNRENLTMTKALGQGAFGEVFQGTYKYKDTDMVEMPVAIKTLPEMSTGQAENDFLMEAAIMAKFRHPNIVHLIGVCFDAHPRFIVLELLAGGDLKNFLREARHSFDKPSTLTIKDLIFCAIDVARGCRYMESKRFIHRDIAARNCLLSSKGPGRTVKIADFGMARDIYRSDYYRKGGKAMLPIKWMPPEAFLDGIFTSKTDVWSFGILLWEVFSMGLMPYPGLPNRVVMELVTGGGRLDAPHSCSADIYTLMSMCWNPVPDRRPTFQYLLHRLIELSEDENEMKKPIPYCFSDTSYNERDRTLMRANDDFCLQMPNSSDYLIPFNDSRAIAKQLLNEGTGITLPETMTTYSPPIELRPVSSSDISSSIERGPISFGDESPSTPFDIRSMPPQNSSSFITTPNPNPTTRCEMLSSQSMSISDKLISLDTPQQTPTAVNPPILFDLTAHKNQLPNTINNHQYIDGNGNGNGNGQIDKNNSNNNHHSNKTTNGPLTLDPSTLESYANVQMTNAQHDASLTVNTTTNNVVSGNNNDIEKLNPPFTIQGYAAKERYTPAKENHSEISC
ncbi:ALK tyrosine kinase receptor isoform X2 [Contarinia nasturtii]|uniref:ALK tyrosine kinase receptor isoform X2 n=1 Tax=Contarinia nasturtii TaxID=265458 RepID=UPI0012D4B194|nr:ALK tyrosine kinase receptor isoform X2 [Contarinia nasturtii]